MDLFDKSVSYHPKIDNLNTKNKKLIRFSSSLFSRPYVDKSEITPFLNSTGSTVSPVAPITSGTSTINRTLLHQHLGQNGAETLPLRNGTSQKRGLAYSGDSPPPDYNQIVVHDNSRHGLFC